MQAKYFFIYCRADELSLKLAELGMVCVLVEGDGRCALSSAFAFLKYELAKVDDFQAFVAHLRATLSSIYCDPNEDTYFFFDHIEYDDALEEFDAVIERGHYESPLSDLLLPLVAFAYGVNVISLWQRPDGLDQQCHLPLPRSAVRPF